MPRKNRDFDPDSYYHITHRGTARCRVFEDRGDYLRFMRLIGEANSRFGIRVFNFGQMPNHVHMLIKPDGGSVPKAMHHIFNSYTKYHHTRHKRSGHLWQERYEPTLIENDNHLYNAGLYIELNPVRAGLVRSPLDWEFSSCRHYCGEVDIPFLTPNPLIGSLGITAEEKKARYLQVLRSHFPDMKF